MATYTALIVFEKLAGRKGTFSTEVVFNDVADSRGVFPDGRDSYQLPLVPCAIVDIIFDAQGVNTKVIEGFINNKSEFRITKSLNTPTTIDRQFRTAPIGIAPGASISLVERVK